MFLKKIADEVSFQLESFKYGFKRSFEILRDNPLMDTNEVRVRACLDWVDYLDVTGRGHRVKNRDDVQKLKNAMAQIDAQRFQAMMNFVGQIKEDPASEVRN